MFLRAARLHRIRKVARSYARRNHRSRAASNGSADRGHGGHGNTRKEGDTMNITTSSGGDSFARKVATLGFAVAMLCAATAAFAGVEANADATGVVLRGYDPVAYFTVGKPVPGSEQFSAEHG